MKINKNLWIVYVVMTLFLAALASADAAGAYDHAICIEVGGELKLQKCDDNYENCDNIDTKPNCPSGSQVGDKYIEDEAGNWEENGKVTNIPKSQCDRDEDGKCYDGIYIYECEGSTCTFYGLEEPFSQPEDPTDEYVDLEDGMSYDKDTKILTIDGEDIAKDDSQMVGKYRYYEHEVEGGGTLMCSIDLKCYDTDGNRRTTDGKYYITKDGEVTNDANADLETSSQAAAFKNNKDKLPKSPDIATEEPKQEDYESEPGVVKGNAGAETSFRYGRADAEHFRRVHGTNGLYVFDEKEDGKTDGKVYAITGTDEKGKPIYAPVGVMTGENDDARIVLTDDKGIASGLEVDSHGVVYHKDDPDKMIGRTLEIHGVDQTGTGSEGTVRYSVKDGKRKSKLYDANGELLTENGVAYSNGAYWDKAERQFTDRHGKQRKGAVRDNLGGYYMKETTKGTNEKITMHHFADGKVYGERGAFVGLFKNKHYFGREGPGGETQIVKSYDQCTGTFSRSTGQYGMFCKEDSGTIVAPWENGIQGKAIGETAEKDLFKDSFGIGSFGWTHFGNAVDTWVGLTSNQYGSLFYSPNEGPAYRQITENDFIRAVLGGIEGVSGYMCERRVVDVSALGGSFSEHGGRSYSHISAERADYMNYSEGPNPPKRYQYLFTIDANPAECNMAVSTWILGKKRSGGTVRKELIMNIPAMERGAEAFVWRGPAKSQNYYSRVCLRFDTIGRDCLAGINSGDEICNEIKDGKQAYDNYVEMFDEEDLTDPSLGDFDGEGSDEPAGPMLNPDI